MGEPALPRWRAGPGDRRCNTAISKPLDTRGQLCRLGRRWHHSPHQWLRRLHQRVLELPELLHRLLHHCAFPGRVPWMEGCEENAVHKAADTDFKTGLAQVEKHEANLTLKPPQT